MNYITAIATIFGMGAGAAYALNAASSHNSTFSNNTDPLVHESTIKSISLKLGIYEEPLVSLHTENSIHTYPLHIFMTQASDNLREYVVNLINQEKTKEEGHAKTIAVKWPEDGGQIR